MNKSWLLLQIFLTAVVISLIIFFALLSIPRADAQVIPVLEQFVGTTSPSSSITQRVYGKALKITGLSTGKVLTLDANSLLTAGGVPGLSIDNFNPLVTVIGGLTSAANLQSASTTLYTNLGAQLIATSSIGAVAPNLYLGGAVPNSASPFQNFSGTLGTGNLNIFPGAGAGLGIGAHDNINIGNSAGNGETTGVTDTIDIGHNAGLTNTDNNTINIGTNAGEFETAGGGGDVNIGWNSCKNNIDGGGTVCIGENTGPTNTRGDQVTLIGNGADVSSSLFGGLFPQNATAIGYTAKVGCSNCFSAGSDIGTGFEVKLGVGTSSPFARLSVGTGAGDTGLYVGSSTAELVVAPNGNIGIGVANPTDTLTIKGHNGNITLGNQTFGSIYNAIYLSGQTPTSGNYALLQANPADGDSNLYFNAPSGGDLHFRVNNGDLLTIKSTGNAQLGTLTSSGSSAPALFSLGGTFNSTCGSTSLKFALYEDTGGAGSRYGYGVCGGTLYSLVPSGSVFSWFNGSTEKMRLDGSGFLGIGTTTPNDLLSIGKGITFGDNRPYECFNCYRDTGGTYRFTQTGGAFAISNDPDTSTLEILASASGNAGAATFLRTGFRFNTVGQACFGTNCAPIGRFGVNADAGDGGAVGLDLTFASNQYNIRTTIQDGGDSDGLNNVGGSQYIIQGNDNSTLGAANFHLFNTPTNSSGPQVEGAFTERLTMLYTGNWGFSTTSPWGVLSVGGHNSNSDPLFVVASSTSGITGTTTNFIIDAYGNVGVGSTSPKSRLSVTTNSTTLNPLTVSTTTGATLFQVDPKGNQLSSGDQPTVSCTPSGGTIAGDNTQGDITTGTLSTACTVTFQDGGYPGGGTMSCQVSDNSTSITFDVSALSNTAVTFTSGTALTGHLYYHCGEHINK